MVATDNRVDKCIEKSASFAQPILDDLPAEDILTAYLLEAAELNKSGIKLKRKPAGARKELRCLIFSRLPKRKRSGSSSF